MQLCARAAPPLISPPAAHSSTNSRRSLPRISLRGFCGKAGAKLVLKHMLPASLNTIGWVENPKRSNGNSLEVESYKLASDVAASTAALASTTSLAATRSGNGSIGHVLGLERERYWEEL
ncbi:hypothetical protein PHJA_001491300 [Phtheirospermum japonicum]|uniref:Uncharacterized protein n=1 Tax=Phtheirospermum japonicum TaxID=374723 RepID=A0A830C337_9LAMI|nr:hypothetical protein PHJA_001491300 [Phtheirospermum japonicum]